MESRFRGPLAMHYALIAVPALLTITYGWPSCKGTRPEVSASASLSKAGTPTVPLRRALTRSRPPSDITVGSPWVRAMGRLREGVSSHRRGLFAVASPFIV
jgi:hypothetical protein